VLDPKIPVILTGIGKIRLFCLVGDQSEVLAVIERIIQPQQHLPAPCTLARPGKSPAADRAEGRVYIVHGAAHNVVA